MSYYLLNKKITIVNTSKITHSTSNRGKKRVQAFIYCLSVPTILTIN